MEVITKTKLPTYLKLLLGEESDITFIYKKKKNEVKENAAIECDTSTICEGVSELELTGDPLKVDLGDDSVCPSPDVIVQKPASWTAEEDQHYAISLNEARSFLEKEYALANKTTPIYAICDGQDPLHTVCLGASFLSNKMERVLVYALPCCNKDHEVTGFEYIKKDHMKNIRCMKDPKINVSIQETYNLYGYNLENCSSLQDVDCNGYIYVEVHKALGNNSDKTKYLMNLQVIVGHKSSPINHFWEELCSIESYISTLENITRLDHTKVINSENTLDCEAMNDLLSDPQFHRAPKKQKSQTADVKNIRSLDILDTLWNVLRRSRTLGDLQKSFYFFLDEMEEKFTRMLSFTEDKSSAADLLNTVFEKKIQPNPSQCLEILIELGLEKLKKDYVAILYNNLVVDDILKKWNEIIPNDAGHLPKNLKRRTLLSEPKLALTDLITNKIKLNFLHVLHRIVEFVFLYTQNVKETDDVDVIYEALCKEHILNFKKIPQKCDLNQPKLFCFSFSMSSVKALTLISDKTPLPYCVKLFSENPFLAVTTVYHFSEYPIFPPSVFDDYEISTDDRNNSLYVTKLLKLVNV